LIAGISTFISITTAAMKNKRDLILLLATVATIGINQFYAFLSMSQEDPSRQLIQCKQFDGPREPFITQEEENWTHPRRNISLAGGKIFYCGHDFSSLRHMFPEYEFVPDPWSLDKSNLTSPQDILLFGMYGACQGFKLQHPRMILYHFRGKVMYVNGESRGGIFDEWLKKDADDYPLADGITRLYAIGPMVSSQEAENTTIREHTLHPFQMTFFMAQAGHISGSTTTPSMTWQWIVDPSMRQKNTGKYLGVAFFVSNCFVSYRQETAKNLSEIVPVYYSKKNSKFQSKLCAINSNNTVPIATEGTFDWANNFRLFHDFKYCLVMENRAAKYYVTEKLLNAFLGGCLPIYYGNDQIFDVFNKNSFIFYDIKNPEPALSLIQQLEDDPGLYQEMMEAPILKDGPNTIDEYFSIFPHIGRGTWNRRIRNMLGIPPVEESSIV
jgi:hypothetical protein